MPGIEIIEIGIIGAILAFAGFIAPLILGRFADVDHGRLMKFSTLAILVTWVVVTLTNNYYVLFALSFIFGILTESFWLSLYKKMIMLGKKYDASYFSVVNEITGTFSKMLILVILLPIIVLFGIKAVFVTMIPISVLFLFLIKE